MSTRAFTTLNLRYTVKPGAREPLLKEIQEILALCEKEPEFVAGFLQETAERPNELLLFEIWRGSREEFIRVQGPKEYRKAYIANSKQYVESVEAIFSAPFLEWGTQLLKG